ncbi:MAG: hypothetical protein R3A52_04590 [Polyangiales bacterium]
MRLTGPRCGDGVSLSGRERATGDLAAGTLTVGDAPAAVSVAAVTSVEPAPAVVARPHRRLSRAAHALVPDASRAAVVAPSPTPPAADPAALLREAEVARRSGESMRARRLLLGVRAARPSSDLSARAAYELGVLSADALHAPRDAARWFEVAAHESRDRSLASDAWGRRARALDAAGDHEAARVAALAVPRRRPARGLRRGGAGYPLAVTRAMVFLAVALAAPLSVSAQPRGVTVTGDADAAIARALDAEFAAAGLTRTERGGAVTVRVSPRGSELRATVTGPDARAVVVAVSTQTEDAEGLFALRVAEAVQAASLAPAPPPRAPPSRPPPPPAPREPAWTFGLDALLRAAPGATGGPVWVSPALRVSYGARVYAAAELSAPTAGGALTDDARVAIYTARAALGYAWRWPAWSVEAELGATAGWITVSGSDGGALVAMFGARVCVSRRVVGPLWLRATVGGDSLNSPVRVARGADVLAEWASPSVTFSLGPALRY